MRLVLTSPENPIYDSVARIAERLGVAPFEGASSGLLFRSNDPAKPKYELEALIMAFLDRIDEQVAR